MTAPALPVRPNRDRPTVLAYAQMALWGWFLYAFGPALTFLREEQGTTRTVSSLHGTALAVGGLVFGLVTPLVVGRLGRGPVLRIGSIVAGIGVLGLTSGLPLPVTLLAAATAAAGGTIMLVGVNAFIPEYQGAAAPAAMNEANGLAATAGLIGPLAIGAGVAVGFGWRAGLWALVGCLVVLELARGRRLEVFDARTGHPDDEPGHAPTGPLPHAFWWAFLLMVLLVSVEFCLSLWGADLLRDRAGFGAAAAAASLAAVVGGMAVGRFGGSRIVERYDAERVLAAAIVLALAAFAVAWLATAGAVVLLALFVTGLGVGLHWPLGVTRAIRVSAGRSDRASGLASVAASLASGLAPFALGALADAVGVHVAFLVVPGLLVAALAVLLTHPVTTS